MPLLAEHTVFLKRPHFWAMLSWICVLMTTGVARSEHPGLSNDEPLLTLLHWVWDHDARLQQLSAERQKLAAQSQAADSLPNLMMSVDLNNVAVDGLDFNQEPMSQLRFGVSQSLPRGDSRRLNSQYFRQRSQALAWQHLDRQLALTEQTLISLLSIQNLRYDLAINQQQRTAIDDLLQWLESAYKNAFGGVQQQHLIQAELELLSNQDQQQAMQQQLDAEVAALRALLSREAAMPADFAGWLESINLQTEPAKPVATPDWQALMKHPAIQAGSELVAAAHTQINLAEQQKKSAFTFRGGYGYRDDAPNGMGRDDLISVGFSMDLPGLNQRKTGELINAKLADLRAAEASREALLQQHRVRQETLFKHLTGIRQRIELYDQQLVPQLGQLAEVEMNAYTNESANFTDVLRAQLRWYEARSQLNKLQSEAAIKTTQLHSLSASGASDLLRSLNFTGAHNEH